MRLNNTAAWVMAAALLISLPLLVIAGFFLYSGGDNWEHLLATVLIVYIQNSLILMVGVSIGVLSMGILTAWFTSMFEFPGRRILSWMLLLPLALPAYIIAYTYTGMLDYGGFVQSFVREFFNVEYGEYWFPEVRSIGGAIALLSLVLYPYVYMMARVAFIEQSLCVLEVSRTLGSGLTQSFIKVAVPLARPAIIAGLSLALMETLADYGTVQYFGIRTFTTGIFRVWFGMDDMITAAKLSMILLIFVFSLILLEVFSRRRARFHHTGAKYKQIKRIKLSKPKSAIIFILCFLPLLFGFILPAAQLILWTLQNPSSWFDPDFFTLVANTTILALAASLIAIILALSLGYARRLNPGKTVSLGVRVSSMGYAIPGTIIAVGALIPLTWVDNFMHAYFSIEIFLSGSIIALLYALTVRFLSVSIQAVDAGLGKIKPSMDAAARSLGLNAVQTLKQIHIPLMKGTVLTAILLVFVDVLKELPATLILRPFNFNTLAVRTFELASDEMLAEAAAPALAIVAVGIIPVILLSASIAKSRAGEQK